MSASDPLEIIGQTIAEKYRIERLVGEGGFAVVYRAEHTIWKKPVAIKFFNAVASVPVEQRDQFQKAFIQEGALLTELSSQTAGIVQARDVGTYTTPEGTWVPFMVLEWLEGRPLDEILEAERAQGAPPWALEDVVRLLSQAANALEVAHRRGIAHRDVKPGNLFVLSDAPDPHRSTLKVLDFGVAKMMSDNTQLKAALAKTGTSVTSFTPQYGAPEQFSRKYGATGPWTDVYALGLVAVEMLTGRPPLDGDDVVQLAYSSSDPQKRPSPRLLGAAVSEPVERVFLKALAVAPEDRFATASGFWTALKAAVDQDPRSHAAITAPTLLAEPVSAALRHPSTGDPSVSTQRSSERTGRGKGKSLLVAGALIAVAGIGAFFALAPKPSETPEPAALPAPPAPPAPSVSASAAVPAVPEGMVKIPGGQYFQGSDAKDAMDSEKPAHQVKLYPFFIDLYEVTAKAYRACSDIGKCKRAGTEVDWPGITPAEKKLYSDLCTGADEERSEHPINCVTWEMAVLYCKAQDKRLPTEAEWEYATRGPDGRIYPWGDEAPTEKHLNACGTECAAWGKSHGVTLESLYEADDGFATTAPVGKFEAGRSRFGPYDVAGNVWEWVEDWFGPYSEDEKQNPTGPESGDRKVIRGGGWNGSYASWLRPSFRYAQDPAATSHGIGFRCARSL